MKNLMENIIKNLEDKNMKQFNEEKFNIKKLQPKETDIELNKCTHSCYDKYTGECAFCYYLLNFDVHDPKELFASAKYIIDKLEAFKTIMHSCGSEKEIRAAKKYFDMIPLLKNIESLHSICIDKLINSSEENIEDEMEEDDNTSENLFDSLVLEDDDTEE